MSIVCLGWGSLVWNPGSLPVKGGWQPDGPSLPLEFARGSRDGRMTLVIVDGGDLCPALWSELDVRGLEEAAAALAAREGCDGAAIGRIPTAGKRHPQIEAIASWCAAKGIAGVVWTAPQPGFAEWRGQVPSRDEIIAHLRSLDAGARSKAAEYVARTPPQIVTRWRPPSSHRNAPEQQAKDLCATLAR